jgi:hypothetical protein
MVLLWAAKTLVVKLTSCDEANLVHSLSPIAPQWRISGPATPFCGPKQWRSEIEELRSKYESKNVYLKIDTQGYDLEVIKGAASTLPTVLALQTELSFQPIYSNMPSFRDVLDLLTRQGFQISALCPVVHDSMLRLVECDCVLINARLLRGGSVRCMYSGSNETQV